MPRRGGYTLTELLIVVAIIGIVAAFGVPRIGFLKEQTNLAAAREQFQAALSSARASALQKGRRSRFIVSNHAITVDVIVDDAGNRDTVVRTLPFDSVFTMRIQLGGTADTLIAFDGRGIASPRLGGIAMFRLVGATRKDSICVTPLGQSMPRSCTL
ncbi:MAG: pilus assembly FimT family protein [Gemmatimonadaceae bacterium]